MISLFNFAYNDENNKVDEIVEGVNVLDDVHNISPALQWDNLSIE